MFFVYEIQNATITPPTSRHVTHRDVVLHIFFSDGALPAWEGVPFCYTFVLISYTTSLYYKFVYTTHLLIMKDGFLPEIVDSAFGMAMTTWIEGQSSEGEREGRRHLSGTTSYHKNNNTNNSNSKHKMCLYTKYTRLFVYQSALLRPVALRVNKQFIIFAQQVCIHDTKTLLKH